MVKLLLLLQTLAALCTSTSSATWLDKEEQQTDVALVDNDHRRPNLRDLVRKPITIGECQGTCGINRRCAENLKCARYNQDALKSVGHDLNFAYCDSSSVPAKNKKNTYFCYDPNKASMPPCRNGIDWNSNGQSCDPNTFGPTCIVVPLDPSYCGPKIIDQYNETSNICGKYNMCPGLTDCLCMDNGYPDAPDFQIMCVAGGDCVDPSLCAVYQ